MARPQPAFPAYPATVKGGGLLFLSGVRPDEAAASFDALPAQGQAKRQGFPIADMQEGLASAQAWSTLERMDAVLRDAGSATDQILRQHIWQADKRWFPCFEQARMHWQPKPSPSSGLGVAALPGVGGRAYGSDAIAALPGEAGPFGARTTLAAPDHADLPSASHYAQAVQSGPLVFTAGFIAIDTAAPGMPLIGSFADVPPEGRALATGRSHPDSRDGPIAAQTWFILNEIRRVLAAQGLAMADVLHASVYLSDLRDFPTFHRVHRSFFPADPPALCVTGFDEVGHRGCRIEIEVTALRPQGGLSRRTHAWPGGTSPFAAPLAVQAGPLVFFSGLLGLDDGGRLAADDAGLPATLAGLPAPLAGQCWWALRRLMDAAGSTGSRLAKCTVTLQRSEDLAVWEQVRQVLVPEPGFAFEAVAIHGPGPVPSAKVQIDAIGVTP